jgi:hypothetical protein
VSLSLDIVCLGIVCRNQRLDYMSFLCDDYDLVPHSKNETFSNHFLDTIDEVGAIVQSRAIHFGRQGHSLTQSKMLHCKRVVIIITYHHVV